MGLFTLLLCCGGDAKDDSDDKYHRQPVRTVNSNTRTSVKPVRSTAASVARKTNAPAAAKKPAAASPVKKSKKDLLDDDNSVNETDTITNTNEEAPPMPNGGNASVNGTNSTAGTAASAGTTGNGTSNAGIAASEAYLGDDKGAHTGTATIPKLLPEQDEQSEKSDNNNVVADSVVDNTDNELFDLTKIQEGQAFNPDTGFLLGKKDKKYGDKKCLILDLDETLVHSSFKYLRTADFVIPVEIDNQVHHVYVIKRPGVDEFLEKVGQWFEVVVFTASVAKYGDPLLDKLDIHSLVHHRLFRDLCYNYQGNFIKNLSQIGRPLCDSIIIDNSPASYIFHPQHSIPISSWFSDTHDNELLDLLPFLEDISKPNVDDVGLVLDITI